MGTGKRSGGGIAASLLVAVTMARASAGEPGAPVAAGRQATPPGPAAPPLDAGAADPDGRRAIRGCQVDGSDCLDDLLEGLRSFEREAFPPPGSDSPWGDEDARPRSNAPGAFSGAARRGPVRPTDLRPDLPWLADLELPDLPIHWDQRIIRFLEFYKEDPRGQKLMREWLRAQGRYRDLILHALRRAHLPEDLLYVAMIESSYDPLDRSRVGASGLWQFMPSGGAIYGLRQNRWVDERNDPVRATEAVTGYFADLYQRFGDWNLSMAAFNAGYGAVLRAIAKYNTNDFWRLLDYENALPWESSIYVPKALAAAIVGRNREKLGFADVVPAPALSYDEVTVPTSVTLAVIARAAGVDLRAIDELNPHLVRGRTPPGLKSFTVRIPRGRAEEFARRFPQLRADWDGYDAYVVRHGERFEDVATLHGISPKKLRELNGLDSDREVEGGMVLVVPRVSQTDKDARRKVAEESLYAAGEPEGSPGDKLLVAIPDPSFQVAGRQRVFYRVVAGDSLSTIARAFRVGPAALATWNALSAEARLQPRMVLQIWVARDFDATAAGVAVLDAARLEIVKVGSQLHIEMAEERVGRERVVYTAARRESYEQIGRRFGLTARSVARINKKPFDTVLEPGETCVIYKVVDPKASDQAAKQARSARTGKVDNKGNRRREQERDRRRRR